MATTKVYDDAVEMIRGTMEAIRDKGWKKNIRNVGTVESFKKSIMLAVDTAFLSSNHRAEVVLYDPETDKPDLIFRIEVIDLKKVDGKDVDQEGWTQFDLTEKP